MTGDRITEAFEQRAERGTARGAESVFAAAASAPTPNRTPRVLLAAAAAVLLIVGLLVAMRDRDDAAIDLDVVAPVEIPAICDQDFAVVGAIADDPPGYCDGVASAAIDGFEPLQTTGTIDAVVAASAAGGWMIDVVPRPELTGAVPLPPDGAGGAAMMLATDPATVTASGFDVSFDLAVGHRGYRGDRNPNAWYEFMLTPARESGALRTGPLYLSDWFGGSTTLSCRFELNGNTICRLTTAGDEVMWQASFVDEAGVGESVGGFEREGLAFVSCQSSDLTAACLDTIRLSFDDGTLAIDLNGRRYFEQGGLPDLPTDLVGDMAQWTAVVTSRSEVELMRFHGGAPN